MMLCVDNLRPSQHNSDSRQPRTSIAGLLFVMTVRMLSLYLTMHLLTYGQWVLVPSGDTSEWCYGDFSIRVWDRVSRSRLKPEGKIAFEAGDLTQPLHTEAGRKSALGEHASHSNRTPTPFVSTTSSPSDALDRAKWQSTRDRGQLYLTVINLHARRRAGLPILRAIDEMKYYGVEDPCNHDYRFYKWEILCPWAISSAEVVKTWRWEEVSNHISQNSLQAWVANEVQPALRDHERDNIRCFQKTYGAPSVRVRFIEDDETDANASRQKPHISLDDNRHGGNWSDLIDCRIVRPRWTPTVFGDNSDDETETQSSHRRPQIPYDDNRHRGNRSDSVDSRIVRAQGIRVVFVDDSDEETETQSIHQKPQISLDDNRHQKDMRVLVAAAGHLSSSCDGCIDVTVRNSSNTFTVG